MKVLIAGAIAALCSCAYAAAPTDADLKSPSSPSEVTTYGMGYGQNRHSALTRINRDNVKDLVPLWTLSFSNEFPQESQPLIIDGVMYVTTTDATLAVDPLTGKQLWKSKLDLPSDVFAEGCCGSHNRGVAAYNGKLFRGTLDARVVALDMKTGKTVWKQKVQEYKNGYTITGAPLVANGVLMTGISGGEYGGRGFIDGWDPDTGKHLWRRYTTAGPGEPGADTWPGDAYLHGGAPTWLTGSYDPDLDLVYWGCGNGGPWNPTTRPGDNLYVDSVIAFHPKDGVVVWHYQFSPNDPYDYDGVNELQIADIAVDGQPRKVIMQANRNGFFYVIDRTNGQLIAANPFIEKITWAKGIDMKTGRPVDSDVTKMVRTTPVMKDAADIWPSALGGKNWSPTSWDAKEGLIYANTLNFGYPYKNEAPDYHAGSWFIAMDFEGFTYPDSGNRGYIKAIEPLTGKARWQVPLAIPNLGGILTTDGGLLFTGAATGQFQAYDSHTGEKLWEYQTGSGVIGQPITWEKDGKQYVTTVSGGGGVYVLFGGDERLKNVPPGGALWTFALHDAK